MWGGGTADTEIKAPFSAVEVNQPSRAQHSIRGVLPLDLIYFYATEVWGVSVCVCVCVCVCARAREREREGERERGELPKAEIMWFIPTTTANPLSA